MPVCLGVGSQPWISDYSYFSAKNQESAAQDLPILRGRLRNGTEIGRSAPNLLLESLQFEFRTNHKKTQRAVPARCGRGRRCCCHCNLSKPGKFRPGHVPTQTPHVFLITCEHKCKRKRQFRSQQNWKPLCAAVEPGQQPEEAPREAAECNKTGRPSVTDGRGSSM